MYQVVFFRRGTQSVYFDSSFVKVNLIHLEIYKHLFNFRLSFQDKKTGICREIFAKTRIL